MLSLCDTFKARFTNDETPCEQPSCSGGRDRPQGSKRRFRHGKIGTESCAVELVTSIRQFTDLICTPRPSTETITVAAAGAARDEGSRPARHHYLDDESWVRAAVAAGHNLRTAYRERDKTLELIDMYGG